MNMNPKNDKEPSEKFKRDGAKYVCKTCKQKFFTRDDVEKCYDSHNANISTTSNTSN